MGMEKHIVVLKNIMWPSSNLIFNLQRQRKEACLSYHLYYGFSQSSPLDIFGDEVYPFVFVKQSDEL